MNNILLKLYIALKELKSSEEGQDLVEYGLLCTLVALSAISGIGHMATSLTKAFSNISTSMA
jgi:Flp pilus assembly pilin Flp